jgi:hypothetical protein
MARGAHDQAVAGNARPDARRGLPTAVRLLLWATFALAVGVLGHRAYPFIVAPYAQAARVEAETERVRRTLRAKEQEEENLRKQVILLRSDDGKRAILRDSQFVKRGQAHLVGDGIGSAPSER